MGIFNTNQTLEEMLEKMNNSQGNTETIHAGAVFINYKLQQQILKEQNSYNSKTLFWSRFLAIATVISVIATPVITQLLENRKASSVENISSNFIP